MDKVNCYHCGDDCGKKPIVYDGKNFCCHGCKTVYEIFSSNDLSYYYDLQASAGAIPNVVENKYDFLTDLKIIDRLVEFNEEKIQIVNLYIPHIHCSSCIWIFGKPKQIKPFHQQFTSRFSQKNRSDCF